MANTVKVTSRTIEVSAIDADYMMPLGLNVWSVELIGSANDKVYIIENNDANDVTKCFLQRAADENRNHYFFGQRLQLGFVFADGTFSAGSKVIFNIGERGY
jgi:hypothetical protein